MKKLKNLALKINKEKQKLIISPPKVGEITQTQTQSKPPVSKEYIKWIIIAVCCFIICAVAVTLYVYFHNKDLCSDYNKALTNYNNSLAIYNNLNVPDNDNLREQQLNYKISYLKACKSLYESVNNYKGTDLTVLNILSQLQTDSNSLIKQNHTNNQNIVEWQKKLAQWNLYNSKGCNDLNNINITISILIGIFSFSFIFFIFRTKKEAISNILNFNTPEEKIISDIIFFIGFFVALFLIIGPPFLIYFLALK